MIKLIIWTIKNGGVRKIDIENNPKIMREILESLASLMVIDAQGRIVYINQNYMDDLGIDKKDDVIGKNVIQIIPNSGLPNIVKTGNEEIGVVWKFNNGKSLVINRIPIMEADGTIIGAIGFTTFDEMNDVSIFIREITKLKKEISDYKSELVKIRGAKYSLNQIIGTSSNIIRLKKLIQRVAQTKSTVLLSGETGTGKELFAHAIHDQSERRHKPFVRVNCASIPNDLLEAELFGYEEGAFTGAKKGGKPGKFEMADQGSILLDEIDQLPLYLQSKLLRAIQEREIDRVGSERSKEIDIRLICTTNKNILDLVDRGEFREDLYYRINVVNFEIPPLRVRIDDMEILVEHFIKKINATLGLHITGVTKELMILFKSYDWPGNIRQLEHTLERAANFAITGTLSLEHVDLLLQNRSNSRIPSARGDFQESFSKTTDSFETIKAQAEKEAIVNALIFTKGNKKKASELLKMDRSVLYEKLKKYRINV